MSTSAPTASSGTSSRRRARPGGGRCDGTPGKIAVRNILDDDTVHPFSERIGRAVLPAWPNTRADHVAPTPAIAAVRGGSSQDSPTDKAPSRRYARLSAPRSRGRESGARRNRESADGLRGGRNPGRWVEGRQSVPAPVPTARPHVGVRRV